MRSTGFTAPRREWRTGGSTARPQRSAGERPSGGGADLRPAGLRGAGRGEDGGRGTADQQECRGALGGRGRTTPPHDHLHH
ncbi:hypothetical protein FNQ90_19455 [Streptomyces alkaliphilus]|uniref:Uncharacterized protein n=1 Tax=Streptomyces alkaliphilus TaxID=1472722 RepID=A0A7W3TG67_9ACTN|nr:hypothetical protein [Streptomyces alkaliphilus]